MTIPLSVILSEDPEEMRKDLTKAYEDLANGIVGHQGEWDPTVIGATTKGSCTYVSQTGYYYRLGLLTDCWFAVSWSGHTGTGNLRVRLPFKIKRSSDVWVGEVSDSSLTYTGKTHLVLIGVNDTFYTDIVASATGAARAYVAVDAVASLVGHLRFIGQESV